MGAYMSFYLFVLFVLLTPGVLLTLPRGGSRMTVAVVHGVVLATILYFSYKPMKRAFRGVEGFQANIEVGKPCELSDQCSSGYCKYKVCVATP